MSTDIWAFSPSEQPQNCLLSHFGSQLTLPHVCSSSLPSILWVTLLNSFAVYSRASLQLFPPPPPSTQPLFQAWLAFPPSFQAHSKAAPPHTSPDQLTNGDFCVAASITPSSHSSMWFPYLEVVTCHTELR